MNIQEGTFWVINFFINSFIDLFLAFNYQLLLVMKQLSFMDRQENKKNKKARRLLKDKEFTQGHFQSQAKSDIFLGSLSLCFCE